MDLSASRSPSRWCDTRGAMPNIDDEQPALTIEARPAPDGNVLVTAGELDLATAPQLSEAAEALIETGAKRLVFEVSGLSFMDSSGLRVLLELSKRAEVVLRAPSRSVRRVVESTGVDNTLTLTAFIRLERPRSGTEGVSSD